MKNVLISLAALAALSSAALATEGKNDHRGSDTYFDSYSQQLKVKRLPYASTSTEAFAVVGDGKKLTPFERMKRFSEENDRGGDAKGSGGDVH